MLFLEIFQSTSCSQPGLIYFFDNFINYHLKTDVDFLMTWNIEMEKKISEEKGFLMLL